MLASASAITPSKRVVAYASERAGELLFLSNLFTFRFGFGFTVGGKLLVNLLRERSVVGEE